MNSYQKKLPRLSIASEYLVPANAAEIRRKSYSVETFVANTESKQKQQQDNQFASNNFNSQICFTTTLNDSLNNLIKNTSYNNTYFVSNQQMDSIETEEVCLVFLIKLKLITHLNFKIGELQ